MATLRRFPVVVEVWGWDEAFLGARTAEPEALAMQLRAAVLEEIGLSCSVGIGDNKQRAKLATGFAKPAGIFRLTAENWVPLMAHRPTEALWGIGRKTATKLASSRLGHGCGPGAGRDPDDCRGSVSSTGGRCDSWPRGRSTTVSDAPWIPRRAATSPPRPEISLTESISRAARRPMRGAGGRGGDARSAGRRVAAEVASCRSSLRPVTTLPAPTVDGTEIEQAALRVLDRFEHTRPVRCRGSRRVRPPPS